VSKNLQNRLRELAPGAAVPKQPRNLVTRSGTRVRGIHTSLRFGSQMQWETPEERTALEVLDASPRTLGLVSQATLLTIQGFEGEFNYVPDIVALREPSRLFVIECKPLSVLTSEEIRHKHQAIALQMKSLGATFIELPNEVQPTAAVLENARLMKTARNLVAYPKTKRLEDWRLLEEASVATFRRRVPARRCTPCPRRLGHSWLVLRHACAAAARNGRVTAVRGVL
jgi:hypothetical protein